MEQSTQESEAIVSRVYEEALGLDGDLARMNEVQRVVYLVEHLMQEVNSGASFEQYFRWASIDEIGQILPALGSLGLGSAAAIVESAMHSAFPNGIPGSEEEMSDLTVWSQDQEVELARLFGEFEELNGHVTNVLGRFVSRSAA